MVKQEKDFRKKESFGETESNLIIKPEEKLK